MRDVEVSFIKRGLRPPSGLNDVQVRTFNTWKAE